MDELVKILDTNLEYIDHRLEDDTLTMRVRSNRDSVCCPYCGASGSRVHSRQRRRFQDLPVMGHRCVIDLERRKMFCDNPECDHKTFAEPFDCLEPYAQRTTRLNEKIIDTVVDMSSVAVAKQLNNGVCAVNKSMICRQLKNGRNN